MVNLLQSQQKPINFTERTVFTQLGRYYLTVVVYKKLNSQRISFKPQQNTDTGL